MKISKTVALVAIGLLVLAGGLSAAGEMESDEAAIRASAPAWAAAFNAGDAEGMANTYWEDAVLMPPGVPSAVGRAAILEYLVGAIAETKAAGLTMVISEPEAMGISGDFAWDSGLYSVTDASGATVDTGKYLAVYQKRDGKWGYVRDTWNSDLAPAAAAE